MRADEIPNNADMEVGMLGCILLSPNEVLPSFISEHKCCADYFYNIGNRFIFDCILSLFNTNSLIDELTLINHIKKLSGEEDAGGLDRVVNLTESTPSAHNWKYYAEELMGYHIKRRLIETGREAIASAISEPNATHALERAQRDILAIAQDQSKSGEHDTPKLVSEYLVKLDDSIGNPNAMMGIKTDYSSLDNTLKGLHRANIIILAARPSVGKTSMAVCIARHVAVDTEMPVGIFSLEMSAAALVQRLIHIEAGVSRDDAKDNIEEISNAASRIADAPLFIDDRSGLSVQQITAAARRMKQQHKIRLLVIDYLQLIRSTRDRGSRNDEVTEISSGCKGLAKELNIPIILVSQLSRSADKDARPPKLSDLRDSGSIEQDADVVLFLWRDPDYKMNDDDLVIPVKLSVDKNRDGLSGVKIPMVFHRELTKFVEGSICSDI